MSLSAALDHVRSLGHFKPADRVHWLEFRKGVELWPDRQLHPELETAYQAVADMPETLANEGALWEELRLEAGRLA